MQFVVRQISGLGNQLFQYAAGRYYSKRYGARMRVAVDPARNAVSHGYPRPFLLSHFATPLSYAEVNPLDRLVFTQKPLLRGLSAAYKALRGVSVCTEPADLRHTFLPDLALPPGWRTVYLVGYWQTHRLVDAVVTELREELTFREAPTGKNLEVLRQIEQSGEAVSLHIRRGDYTLAAEGNIALPIQYYVRAIEMFRERLTDPTFFVFSDDMEFARTQLPPEARLVFVDHNDASSSHEDLRLMSSCRHHIIANSTFSWWGAWLNARTDKIVHAPRQWHRNSESYFPDLLPPEWVLTDFDGKQ